MGEIVFPIRLPGVYLAMTCDTSAVLFCGNACLRDEVTAAVGESVLIGVYDHAQQLWPESATRCALEAGGEDLPPADLV